MRSRVLGGAAWVLKNSPSFLPFSSLSGGYQEISAGFPSKKSKTQDQHQLRALGEDDGSSPGMKT